MTIPEPDEFTLEEIAKRWSAIEGEEYTVDYLYRLEVAGRLKIEYEFVSTDTLDWGIKFRKDIVKYRADGLSASEAARKATFDKDLIRCFITKTERDRVEREPQENDLQSEPMPKTKGAYLRLIGCMAELLAKKGSLTVSQPFTAANEIIEVAELAGKNVGSRSSIGQMLQDAIERWEES